MDFWLAHPVGARRAPSSRAGLRARFITPPRDDAAPILRLVTQMEPDHDGASGLEELCRRGARRMLAAALESEIDDYVARLRPRWSRKGPWASRSQGGPPDAA